MQHPRPPSDGSDGNGPGAGQEVVPELRRAGGEGLVVQPSQDAAAQGQPGHRPRQVAHHPGAESLSSRQRLVVDGGMEDGPRQAVGTLKRAQLENGDRITLGSTELVFERGLPE